MKTFLRLPPELDPLAAAQLEVLEDRHVGQDDLRQLVERDRRVADVAAPGQPAERSNVEEAAGAPGGRIAGVAAGTHGVAANARTRAAVAAGEVEVVRRRCRGSGPVAADPRRVARELPAIE